MGKQSKLKKLKRQCRNIVNTNFATKQLDETYKQVLVDEVYKKSKASFINASKGSHLRTPKTGQSE